MKIPRYWTRAAVDERGHPIDLPPGPDGRDHPGLAAAPAGGLRGECFIGLGWSDRSLAEAEALALERARRIAGHFAPDTAARTDAPAPPTDWYAYDDRPVREQIVDRDDEAGWITTRNATGALVLNTAHAMFIDIDGPSEPRAMPMDAAPGCLGFILGAAGQAVQQQWERQLAATLPAIRERVREVVDTLEGLGVRLYRTRAGFRALVTTDEFDPTSDLARDTMDAFGADPKYVRLCRAQETFRARLTPKPWRCPGLTSPPARFPFRTEQASADFDRWRAAYDQARAGYATCELVETLGPDHVADAIRPILDLHDGVTLAPGRPLA